MKIKETLLKIIAGAASLLAAIYYVLFKQAKEERLILESSYNEELAREEKLAMEKYAEGKKENEELKNKARIGSDDDRDAAATELLRLTAEKGKRRNTK